jgi:hypothetical protein
MARASVIGILLTLSCVATANAVRFPRIVPPQLLIIDGYLDKAPASANVIDRVEVFANGKPKRWLLVTSYAAPGQVMLDRYLSWPQMHTYGVSGSRDDVSRFMGAPAGTEVKGTFRVYVANYPLLVIASLDLPA